MTRANDASLVSPANHVVITCHQQTIASQVCHGHLCLASCRQHLVARLPVGTPSLASQKVNKERHLHD